jgi:hypothetical protein
MQNQEIDRFQIGLRETGTDVEIFLLSPVNGLRAKATVNRKSRRVAFLDASNIAAPTDHVLLEEESVDLTKYFNRGICAGNQPEMVILDQAYMFVLNNDAPHYDEPSVETEEYDIVLRANSSVQVPPVGAGGTSSGTGSSTNGSAGASSGAGRGKGARKPKRRKTQINVWI